MKDRNRLWIWISLSISIVIIIFYGTWYQVTTWYGPSKTISELGDSFGYSNTLFSGLAFAVLIVTLFLQMKELELQRIELSSTREELEKSAKAQDATQKALNTQARILGKQALLTSYQSRYDAVQQMDSRELKHEEKLELSIKYLKLIELAAIELENEQGMFIEQTTIQKINKIKNEKIDLGGGKYFFF